MTDPALPPTSAEWKPGDDPFTWRHGYVGLADHGPCNVEIAHPVHGHALRCLRSIDDPIHRISPGPSTVKAVPQIESPTFQAVVRDGLDFWSNRLATGQTTVTPAAMSFSFLAQQDPINFAIALAEWLAGRRAGG